MHAMTPKEAILKTLNGERTERVPVALVGGGMWSSHHYGVTFEELSGNASLMSDMLVKMSNTLRSDIVYAGSGYPNFPVAALGGRIKFREIGTPDLEGPLITSEEDLEQLDISRIDKDPVITAIRRAYDMTRLQIGAEYVVTMTSWAPFTLAARFMGEEVMMKAVFKKPAFVEKALELATQVLIRFYAPLLRDRGLDVILLGDPTASGDLISKIQFAKFVVPHLKKFTDWARDRGAYTIVHICGNTTDRLELFPLTGAGCISLDHKTDMAKAKEVLHGTMCFAGNVDPVKILLQGSPKDVGDACKRVIETAGTDGGFILMPGCDIPPTVPYENIRAFIQVARDWKLK